MRSSIVVLALAALTAVNVGLFAFARWGGRAPASTTDTPSILRARGLEIVDDQGRVRATIQLLEPPGAGAGAQTAILRLIDENGRPNVKLAASNEGSGLSIVGATDENYLVLSADAKEPIVRAMQQGQERRIFP